MQGLNSQTTLVSLIRISHVLYIEILQIVRKLLWSKRDSREIKIKTPIRNNTPHKFMLNK